MYGEHRGENNHLHPDVVLQLIHSSQWMIQQDLWRFAIPIATGMLDPAEDSSRSVRVNPDPNAWAKVCHALTSGRGACEAYDLVRMPCSHEIATADRHPFVQV